MIETIRAKVYAAVVWQTPDSDDGVPEPVVVVESFSDVIELRQAGNSILLNYGSVKDLCKVLREARRDA